MLYLRTLGGLSITTDTGLISGAGAQRGRLALLAVLAAAGEHGVSRDRLLAIFWPESDSDRARTALRQALYALRRDLGERALTLGSSELRLNPAIVASDVGEFIRAIDQRELELAVRSYTGPFLDGIHLADALDFEVWSERQRDQLRHSYRSALDRLAAQAAGRREWEQAAEWLRRRADDDPFSAKAARNYMEALAAAGHREAAIQHARTHAARVRNELEIAPDPQVLELAATLGSERPTVERALHGSAIDQPQLSGPAVGPTPSTVTAGSLIAPTSRPKAWLAFALIAVVVMGLVVVRLIAANRHPSSLPDYDPALTVVMPFTVDGPPPDQFLGNGVARLIGRGLEGLKGWRVVDQSTVVLFVESEPARGTVATTAPAIFAADHFAAGRYVTGDIVIFGDSAVLRATLRRRAAPDSVVRTASASGRLKDIFLMADRVTGQLAATSFESRNEPIAQSAVTTTNSLEAYERFLEGEDALRHWRFADARDSFHSALLLDSTFALAYYRLSVAADWTGNSDLMRWAAARAMQYAAHLGVHERLLVQSMGAWRELRIDEAEALIRRVVVQWPTDAEAWYDLAEILFHSNYARGRSMQESRDAFEQTIRRDPRHWDAWLHLARLDAMRGDRASADSEFKRVVTALPESLTLDARVLWAFLDGDATRERAILAELRPRSEAELFNECTRVAAWAHQLAGAEAVCRLLTLPERPPAERANGLVTIAYLELAEGHRSSARAMLAQIPPELRAWRIKHEAWLECLPQFAVDTLRSRIARDSLTALAAPDMRRAAAMSWWDNSTESTRFYLLARLSACVGDENASEHWARLLRHYAPSDTLAAAIARKLSLLLSAEHEWRIREWTASIRDLDASDRIRLNTFEATAGALSRYLRAEDLMQLGRPSDARGWFYSFDGEQVIDLAFAAAAYRKASQLDHVSDSPSQAIADSLLASRLWQHPDADVRW